MKLLILSGFLGSGKTTLMLRIVRKLQPLKIETAIIENEIGEIGIDGQLFSHEKYKVKELYGGCICCTLSVGLIEALGDIERNYKPSLIIIESTGMAEPGQIIENIKNSESKPEQIHILTVVDWIRFEMLIEMMRPLMVAQMSPAGVIAITKADDLEPEILDRISGSISEINPHAEIVIANTADDIWLDNFIAGL